MKKKILIGVLAFLAVGFTVFGIITWGRQSSSNTSSQQKKIYDLYVTYTESLGDTPLSYEEWLNSIKGEKGDTGANGSDGNGIASANINDKGELVLTYTSGETVNLGVIKGSDGKDATGISSANINDKGELVLTYTNGETANLGVIKGTNGNDGNGIASVEINDKNELVLTYTNGEKVNLGIVKGDNGNDGNGIVSADINEKGELVLTYTNGETVNLGVIKGSDGKGIDGVGFNKKGELILILSDGETINLGIINGSDGNDGNGISSAEINDKGELVLSYTNGSTVNLGVVKGDNGNDGNGISSAEINEKGELVLTYTNGSTVNLGVVKGNNGNDGNGISSVEINDKNELVLTYTNGTSVNLGNVKGDNGNDGNGISSVEINDKNELVLTYTNGTSVNLGNVKGSDGKDLTGCEHDFVVDYVRIAPTCTETGIEYDYCTKCNIVKRVVLDALGHSFTNYVSDGNTTCTTDGTATAQCDRCEAKDTIVEKALGHSSNSWIVDKMATEIETGSKHKECTVCHTNYTAETIPVKTAYVWLEENKSLAFGEYPQTQVTDDTLHSILNAKIGNLPTGSISDDWPSYEYYVESINSIAYVWYKDVEYNGDRYRAVYFNSYRPYSTDLKSSTDNSYSYENGYEINTVYFFKWEPLTWSVLKQSDGTAMILCDYVIDSQEYNANLDNNYANSSIRAWLNDNFYNTAFTSLQQSIIETTTVDNSARSTNPDNNATCWNNGVNSYACDNTNDKVFLLSEQEVTTKVYGFEEKVENSSTRCIQGTDYAKCLGVGVQTSGGYKGNCYWWTRTAYYSNKNMACYIGYGGEINASSTNRTYRGVLPTLNIKL